MPQKEQIILPALGLFMSGFLVPLSFSGGLGVIGIISCVVLAYSSFNKLNS